MPHVHPIVRGTLVAKHMRGFYQQGGIIGLHAHVASQPWTTALLCSILRLPVRVLVDGCGLNNPGCWRTRGCEKQSSRSGFFFT